MVRNFRKVGKKLKGDRRLATVKLLLSPILGALTAFILSMNGAKGGALLSIIGAYLFTPAGKTIILAGPALGIGGLTVLLTILLIDALVSAWLIWNFDYSKRLPWIGKKIAAAERKTRATFMKRPRLRKLSYLGIALFITLPGPGTGIIVGTILGRLLSLNPRGVFVAAMFGSLLSSMLIFPAYFGLTFIDKNFLPLPFFSNITGALLSF